ncbi:hypothetical protein AMK59_844 [Oryctes borbonicus]|uniref:ACB domain-containing protein n=1 Tax=Oryctes borbonicus TaxID=1629725 RepID=A0A0T6BAA4_9SCAR|nr:hypothetical protein AMK59_844 [Oryctes borbonicus]
MQPIVIERKRPIILKHIKILNLCFKEKERSMLVELVVYFLCQLALRLHTSYLKMAADTVSSQLTESVSNLTIHTKTVETQDVDDLECHDIKYGLPLLDVYKLALCFYKEKEGKAVHFSYEDKLQLVAFTQQVIHGPFTEAVHKLPPLGALDVVGKDRRLAWQKLGNLTSDQARAGFVELLSRKCALFSTFIEAHRREKKEKQRLAKEAEKQKILEEQERLIREAEEKIQQEQREKEESIKRQIQQALNEQTYDQFRKYAEQHYPGDPEKQGALVKQLQEQHYIQYMQQLQAVQKSVTAVKQEINNENNSEESAKKVSHC